MRFRESTPEEKEINEAIDVFTDALQFQFFVFKVAGISYLVGLPLFIFGNESIERIGMALTLIGVFSFCYHAILSFGIAKKKRAVDELLKPYLKRKSLPLFQDLVEKFADDPDIRFRHEDNGTITVIRKNDGFFNDFK